MSNKPKEKYPGMKVLATRLFAECPVSKHGELSRQMKFFLESAKAQGIATQLDWAAQTKNSLTKMFGSPSATTPVLSPKVHPNCTPNQTTRSNAHQQIEEKLKKRKLTAAHSDHKMKVKEAKSVKHNSHQSTDNGKVVSTSPKKNLATSLIESAPHMEPSIPKVTKEELRKSRFQNNSTTSKASPYSHEQITERIVGTNETLEKTFFRLTGQVNPAVVRPPRVLANSLEFVYGKYCTEKGYAYLTSQLQSIRQDLTVQHVENELTIQVYELNTRVALFHEDLGEFNKCLTKVVELHNKFPELSTNFAEFKAYSCYYMLLLRKWEEISLVTQSIDTTRAHSPCKRQNRSRSTQDLPEKFMLDHNLFPKKKKDQYDMLDRALVCIHKVQQQDFFGLVDEYRNAWPLELKLLNIIVNRERARALEGLLTSTLQQKQSLPVHLIAKWLGTSINLANTLMESWKIPVAHEQVSSEQALPFIRQILASLDGVFDIKGQI